MAGIWAYESSFSLQKAGNVVALSRKLANVFGQFLLSLATTAMFRSDTGCHVCGKRASRKSSFVNANKEICTCRCCYSKIKISETSKGRTPREDLTAQPALTAVTMIVFRNENFECSSASFNF